MVKQKTYTSCSTGNPGLPVSQKSSPLFSLAVLGHLPFVVFFKYVIATTVWLRFDFGIHMLSYETMKIYN
jgi:hypothetical protein